MGQPQKFFQKILGNFQGAFDKTAFVVGDVWYGSLHFGNGGFLIIFVRK